MLTWDDEVTPSPQRTHTPPASNSPSGVTASPSLAMHTPSPASASLAAAQASAHAQALAQAAVAPRSAHAGGRVSAADKRIINGQTDVNQLVPFKY